MDKYIEKMKKLGFEFYKAEESESSKFIMIPKQFYKCPFYNRYLTATTRELYAFLVDRMSLSEKTTREGSGSFVDENGYIYLVFTRAEAMETLDISKQTCSNAFKTLNELGLIYEKRLGQGKNNLIYIGKLKYMSEKEAGEMIELVEKQGLEPKTKKSKKQTSKKSKNQKSKNQKLKSLKNRLQGVEKLDRNNTKYTNTEYTYTESSSSMSVEDDKHIGIYNLFESEICKLMKTTMPKFVSVVEKHGIGFIRAVIEECVTTSVKSYKGFESALNNYLKANCKTAEEVHTYAKEYSENNKAKRNKVNSNKNTYEPKTKKLKFNDFDQRVYDYNDLENKLLGWSNSEESTEVENNKQESTQGYAKIEKNEDAERLNTELDEKDTALVKIALDSYFEGYNYNKNDISIITKALKDKFGFVKASYLKEIKNNISESENGIAESIIKSMQ